MTYAIETLAENGDLIDLRYLCSSFCAWDAEKLVSVSEQVYGNGQERYAVNRHFGVETDYDVWCAQCGDFMWHGMHCECDDTETPREPVKQPEGVLG